jgi:hypothetical protein
MTTEEKILNFLKDKKYSEAAETLDILQYSTIIQKSH